jgi:hypothetical protein
MKPEDRSKIAGRIALFHEVITRGLKLLHDEVKENEHRPGPDVAAALRP